MTEVSCVSGASGTPGLSLADRFPPGTAQSILHAAGPYLSSCAFAAIDDALSGRTVETGFWDDVPSGPSLGIELWARVAAVLLARKPPGPLGLPEDQLHEWLEASWAVVASSPESTPHRVTDEDAVPVATDREATTRLRAAVIPPPLSSPVLGTASGAQRESAREKFERRAASDPLGQTHFGSGRRPGMDAPSRAYDPRDPRKRT